MQLPKTTQFFSESSVLTLPWLLKTRVAKTPNKVAAWQLDGDRNWTCITWRQYLDKVISVARGLQKLRLKAGDRVAILAPSSIEWDVAQLAITAAGGVAVGIDPHGLSGHIQTIARSCGFTAIFVGCTALAAKLGEGAESRLSIKITFEATAPAGWISLLNLLDDVGADGEGFEWDRATPDDVATIIYTSGTTGDPKGIAYSHRQICLATTSILSCFPSMEESSRLICWLPLSNLFQRMINLCGIDRGAETYYLADPREVMQYVATISPHLFIAVPRFFEKLYSGIEEGISAKPLFLQSLIRWSLAVGNAHATALRQGTPVGIKLRLEFVLADSLVLSKFRRLLGTNLQFMVSGSAPMPVWLLERFHALGFLILEAYGLSENVIPVAVNRPERYRFGTVGCVLPGCEIYLAEDTELFVRGPGVFKGYLGDRPESSPVRPDGYLPSGDFARIDADGYITLIGRKADIFKTSTGRRIAPAEIEGVLLQVQVVDNVAIFGAKRSKPVALVTINRADCFSDPKSFSESFRQDVEDAVALLPGYLHPAGVVVSASAMTIEGGELTANLKLRRRNVESIYQPMIERLYELLDENKGKAFYFLSPDRNFLYISI